MMLDLSFTQQTDPLSVVIPTLGGESLARTIEQLNHGTIVPEEILVCIPEETAFRIENMSFHNVKIVKTKCRGQVAQRALGFQQACHELVLQFDDDIHPRETCLQSMIECLARFSNVAVGLKMHDIKTDKYHCFLAPVSMSQSFFEKLLYWVINGAGTNRHIRYKLGPPEVPMTGMISDGCRVGVYCIKKEI